MGKRTDLHEILKEVLGSGYVYFQPPEKFDMGRPCIIYSRSSGKTNFANNSPYKHLLQYTVTVIDSNPDSQILDRVKMLPMCTFERHYKADNLNHDVYNIYY